MVSEGAYTPLDVATQRKVKETAGIVENMVTLAKVVALSCLVGGIYVVLDYSIPAARRYRGAEGLMPLCRRVLRGRQKTPKALPRNETLPPRVTPTHRSEPSPRTA